MSGSRLAQHRSSSGVPAGTDRALRDGPIVASNMFDLLPLLGLLGLLFVKEAGLPVPVPGDLLVLGAGVAAAGAGPGALPILGAILVAGYLGGSVQFLLVRDALRGPMLRLLARVGIPEERLEALGRRLRTGGARAVAISRATPAVRIGVIAASGLAALPFAVFVRGLVVGNTVFVGGHFGLGYALGAPATELVGRAGGLGLLVVGIAVLAVGGAVGWRIIARRRIAARPALDAAPPASAGLGPPAWADAGCPACLALTLLRAPIEDGAATR